MRFYEMNAVAILCIRILKNMHPMYVGVITYGEFAKSVVRNRSAGKEIRYAPIYCTLPRIEYHIA